MTNQGRAAIEQLVARFVFDDEPPAEMQRNLARHIEAAIADFKATQMQELIARTLRRAITDHIQRTIEAWDRSYHYPQPIEREPDSDPPLSKRRPPKKAAAQEASL
jgi:hypothetical protein